KRVNMPVKRVKGRIDVSSTLQNCYDNRVKRLAQLNPIRGGESKKGRISRGFPQIGVSTLPIFYCPSHLFPRFLLPLLPTAFGPARRAVRSLGRCVRSRLAEVWCAQRCPRPERAEDRGVRALATSSVVPPDGRGRGGHMVAGRRLTSLVAGADDYTGGSAAGGPASPGARGRDRG